MKSFYNDPGQRLQYDNWKRRNDSKQISSNISWNATLRSGINNRPTRTNLPLRLHRSYGSKTRNDPRKVIISEGYRDFKKLISRQKSPMKCKQSYPVLKNNVNSAEARKESHINLLSDSSDDEDSIDSHDIGDLFLNKCSIDDLETLRSFRDEYYFECHSTKRKSNPQSVAKEPHVCHHDFIINKRLYPEAIYADHHKTSRCRDCHLPLNDKITDEKVKTIHLCRFSQFEKFNDNDLLSDGEIDDSQNKLTKRKSEIFIKVPQNQILKLPQRRYNISGSECKERNFNYSDKLFDTLMSRRSGEIPSDSLALRYHKK